MTTHGVDHRLGALACDHGALDDASDDDLVRLEAHDVLDLELGGLRVDPAVIGDLPAALRDPQELCIDLAEDIDSVQAAVEYVTKFFPLMYEDLSKRIEAHGLPSTTWTPALHMGKSYVTSCDFICMISPAMFEATILPSLVEEMKYLERNIFHLDGPGALRHLDALLAIPQLNGIQWTYGAGNGPARRWMDVYKRVQAAGKNLFIALSDWQDLDAMIENLRPEGVWLVGLEAQSVEHHAEVVRRLERWAANKP